jgi:hypothetical protein
VCDQFGVAAGVDFAASVRPFAGTVAVMQRWWCAVCQNPARFDASRCEHCGSLLGYVPADLAVRNVTVIDDTNYAVDDHVGSWWRCLNAAYGCNWMLPAGSGDVWCRSCRLTRGRPDNPRSEAVAAWASAEASKRRLIHQLDSLGLAVDALSPEQSDGLMFDLVHLDDGGATTGYNAGVVTLDLAEADAQHRELLRWRLGESFRTVIGHLRHEAGHHYFRRLISQSDDLAQFRALFGDETSDYGEALAEHYANPAQWDPARHITAYATAHPLEDWAETFAHYLHMRDASETATSHGMLTGPDDSDDFAGLLAHWHKVIEAVNAIAESLDVADVYPFMATGVVRTKFAFVHQQVTKNAQRRAFYSPH